ncbi:MAG: tRNA uridine-5-carboxymethylaminomethyl(34) synthesis GTPase MnmE [Candidatus Abyssobacteria bacterium SURF_17]|uniref:tRNA modification GTPase MnmE n=1 Tax=Candidatus Abyssobacteria bacterium SURF_17 TaxID=2093361 RepID=A0A419F8A0_9BACT|nr:MAG: tRNA uridine-5-carboxymethylaminomethyl(34) synthesis GTPase MnmE [Candidatus Abyssubacteria bacterium SURF_17]
MSEGSTICAVSTPPGRSGIGIVRLSGPEAIDAADRFFTATNGRPLHEQSNRRLIHGHVLDEGCVVDEVLASVMRSPHSYTTEDVVEINCHGGIIAVRRTLELALKAGARLAEPGEFTKRAFLGGRIDLAQAEAVADLIGAKTAASLRAATNQLQGRLSERIMALRDRLADCLARIEATIDFPEDEVPPLPGAGVAEVLEEIRDGIDDLISNAQGGRLYRDGITTVIVGKPNVGKSSILNAILSEPRAIVTEEPGTTRDVIVESVDLRGIALRLCDTAGIREPGCEVERLGVERSERALDEADLALFIADSSQPLSAEDVRIIERLAAKPHVIVAANKIDLKQDADMSEIARKLPGKKVVRTSATEGIGIKELGEAIFNEVTNGAEIAPEEIIVSRLRHQKALERARTALRRAGEALANALSHEFVAVDLRDALDALGEIVGAVVTDDLLERIFSEFCIGK